MLCIKWMTAMRNISENKVDIAIAVSLIMIMMVIGGLELWVWRVCFVEVVGGQKVLHVRLSQNAQAALSGFYSDY
jgi:hypothetical protein